ncbi:MAG: glycosyltransferase [Candidatus Omnitrophota bacterium]
MRIAFFAYPHSFQVPGGGEILLLKTKESLEKKGISVKLFNQWEDKLKNFDILHVFGSVKDCLGLMEAAKPLGVKVVLSPIFWSTLNRAFHEYGGINKKLNMSVRHLVKAIFPIMPSSRRRMLQIADSILPNSKAEVNQLIKLFAADKNKMHVCYLAADERFSKALPDEFTSKFGINDFILSVGRIEPRKNQLNLIKALKGCEKKLVIIGNIVLGYEKYYEACRNLGGSDVLFINNVNHESSILASAYAACRVFVLQGWFETPGLVALEAGLAGANLAVTNAGSTKEYFAKYAEYFNPASSKSIRTAVFSALKKNKTDELKKHIMNNFTWGKYAEENIKVYNQLMKG